ncbi:putative lipoprotein [Burkholderia cenocepacia]|nr:putative lipoprotein [Burkholderia cenocepacia]CAB5085634.1 putative lipoprotein [Burkholderia cenocepacia]CAB5100277.1 putative lipoprotein [Burkholderia cenocepacia]CAB5122404.1 putative lipoprotein [Burkholderia cenocepacia]CAB5124218.1 putative lipoprotein [Burkholderia cenocepacia]
MNNIIKSALCAAFVPFVLAGCGGGDDGGGTQTGTLHVAMTDAPSCGFDHVYVTVSQVRVNANANAADNDGGWSTVSLATPQKIDLLSLTNGVLAYLGQTALPAGQYQQVRLVLAQNQGNTLANSVVPSGGTEQALATPSATQSGYKIIQPFTVQPNTLVDLVLDFNACKSIVQRGNGSYALKPVVTAIPTVVSGAISGYVAAAEAGATVYAEQGGKVVRGTVADSSGKFVLSPLIQSSTQGNYDVVIVQNNFASGIVRSVPVVVNTTTAVSASNAPITLPASTMSTVGGMVTASANAFVRALQTIDANAYEITSINANMDTGAYSLSVPAAAPIVGTYSGSLPVALAAAPAAAGQYTIEADAASGATQSANVNATTSQSNVNFSF